MSDESLVVVIPTYSSPGSSILPTLNSLEVSVRTWTSEPYTLVLSDSSPTDEVRKQCRSWAEKTGCTLVVEHSSHRLWIKEALNVAFSRHEVTGADFVVVTNDDVLLDTNAVSRLLDALKANGDASIAVGCARPDQNFSRGFARAGAFQLRAGARLATKLPLFRARAEGALWATRGPFVGSFRYPIGEGSISDDVELQEYILRNGLLALNVSQAIAYKVPPASFRDFASQNRRSMFAAARSSVAKGSKMLKLRAFVIEIAHDPLGALHYLSFRLLLKIGVGKDPKALTEQWERSTSTFR